MTIAPVRPSAEPIEDDDDNEPMENPWNPS
jgi:hypothetical protein